MSGRESDEKRIKKKRYAPLLLYALLAIVGIAGVVATMTRDQKEPPLLVDKEFADLGNDHITDTKDDHTPYNSVPPTSGAHVGSAIAPWGVHDAQVPDELQVHNLEDGGVIIHYDPARIDDDTRKKLTDITNRYATQVILEPYVDPALSAPIVLTAWTRLAAFEQYDEERILAFILAYRGIDHHKK